MRHLATGLAAALLVLAPIAIARANQPAAAAVEPIESLLVLAVEGDVYINADGSLADYRIETPAPGNTAQNVLRIVRGWHFEPVLVDGKPQAVVARMRVALAATQVGDGHQVRIDNVSFPGLAEQRERARAEGAAPSLAKHKAPVVYPPGLQKSGVTGRVLVALRYDDSGKVTDAAALQSMLYDRRESAAVTARAIELLEDASLRAARSWRIEAPTSAPWRIVVTPIDFVMNMGDKRNYDGTSPSGRWRLVSRTPKRHVQWMDAKPGAPSVSDVEAGVLVPVADATLKLSSPVVGTLL